jgi:hypothetical protein
MANRVRTVALTDEQRAVLQRRVRRRGAPAREVERARIVLLTSDGGARGADRRAGRVLGADGDPVAVPLRRPRPRGAGRRTAAGEAADDPENQIWCAIVVLACRPHPPGCRPLPSPTTTPAARNPNGSGCGCSPPPPDDSLLRGAALGCAVARN